MKKFALVTTIILITASITAIAVFGYLTSTPAYNESVIQTEIYSNILQEKRPIAIHLPRGYNPDKNYPVNYVLDGTSLDIPITKTFDILSTAGYVPKTIIVAIPNLSGKSRQRDYTPPHMRMDIDIKNGELGEGDKFLSFIQKELIPYVDKNYSTSNTRLFSGYSRGGLLVMYSLLQKPNLFEAHFCFSPAFWRENDLIVSKAKDFFKSTDTLNTFLYMSLGSEENDKMRSTFDKMTKVLKEKAPVGVAWYSEIIPGADHHSTDELSIPSGIGKWSKHIK